jgi:hypothetical protein
MQRGVYRAVSFTMLVSIAHVCSTARVRAQSIDLPTSMNRKQRTRSASQLPNWVSRADCLARDVLTFSPVTLHDYAGYDLEVWAGNRSVDCANADNRDDGGACFEVFSAKADSPSVTVRVDALDLVARGAATPDYPDVCNGVPSKKRTPLSLTFVLVDSDGAIGGKPAIFDDIGYDVSPPAPPTALSASESETRIYLDWKEPDDLDLNSYRFYCDPPPGSVLPDGGLKALGAASSLSRAESVDASGGSVDGGSTQKSCAGSDVLAAGVDPTSAGLEKYVCGSIIAGEHSGTVNHLVNGVEYAVAVASVDEVGNVSVLSRPVCEKPIPLTDFFELYRQAGGKAGGGLCSLSHSPSATAPRVESLFGGLSLCAIARRRRRLRYDPRNLASKMVGSSGTDERNR